MRHGIYARPRDLRALTRRGGFERLRQMGFEDVAIAVTEDGGRQLTPWSPEGPFRQLEEGVVHFRPGDGYGRLRPQCSRDVAPDGPTPLEWSIVEARRAGLAPWAWARPFHDPRLAAVHAGSRVVNAFGQRYRHALCPARDEVQEYAVALIESLAAHEGLAGVELQSLGFASHRRGFGEATSALPPQPYVDFLSSLCFCDVCHGSLRATGLEPRRIQADVAELVLSRLAAIDAFDPPRPLRPDEAFRRLERELGDAVLFALWSHRLSVYMRLLRRIRSAAAGRLAIALHVRFHSLFAGDAIGAPLEVVANHADELVVAHDGEPPEEIARAWQADARPGVRLHAAISPKAPEFRGPDDVARVVDLIASRGGAGLRIRELGVLPWQTLQRIGSALSRTGQPATTG